MKEKKYKIIALVSSTIAIVAIVFVISNSYAASNQTVYTRDELSEIVNNQNNDFSLYQNSLNDSSIYTIFIDDIRMENIPNDKPYILDSYICSINDIEYDESDNILLWNTYTHSLEIINIDFINSISCSLDFKSYNTANITLAEKIYNDNTKLASRTNFTTEFTANTTGSIYYTSTNTESTCDSGDTLTYVSGSGANAVCKTYYFAGVNTKNYVKYGNMLWSIIRINEDQSVRLILNEDLETGKAYISGNYWNNYLSCYDPRYVGYMYNPPSSSNVGVPSFSYADAHTNSVDSMIKTRIDTWYVEKLLDYNSYVSQTAIYCNDRSLSAGIGYGTSTRSYFGSMGRLYESNKSPIYKCPLVSTSLGVPANNNLFTVSSTTGNGKLTYGVALPTGDELLYIGVLVGGSNGNNFLATSSSSSGLTMTPAHYTLKDAWGTNNPPQSVLMNVGYAHTHAYHYTLCHPGFSVRPELSLKSCVKYAKGDGTKSNPYEIIIDSTCANAIN